MAKRKNPVLLRVAIVAVAVLLGMSLNAFQGKNPFKGIAAYLQTPAKEQPVLDAERESAVVPAPGRDAAGAQAVPAEPGSQKPADASRPQAKEPGAAAPGPGAPAASARTGQAKPDDLGQTAAAGSPRPEAPASAPWTPPRPETPASPEPAASLASQQAREPVPALPNGQGASNAASREAGAPSGAGQPAPEAQASQPAPAAPKTVSSVDAIRSARLGRQVPLETGPAASGQETAKRGQASSASAQGVTSAQKTEPERAGGAAKPEATPRAESVTPPPSQPEKAALDSAKTGSSASGRSSAPDRPGQSEKSAQPEKAAQSGKPVQPEKAAAEANPRSGQDEAKPAKTGKLVDIRAQDRPGEVALTIITDMAPEKVTKFLVGKPSRLAVDLWGSWRGVDPSSREFDSELIERVRVGWHQDRIRVVIDFRDKEQAGMREPVIEISEQGVVVRVGKPAKPKE